MATQIYRGSAPPIAKVITCTVGGTIEATDIFIMTMGLKSLSVVAGSTTAATVATTIAAAWNALSATSYPEFAEITAAATTGGAFTLTSDVAGVNFSVTLTTTETGGGAADDQTFTQSTTTANSGPNDWSCAANWSTGSVPVDSDDVILEQCSEGIYYGLDQNAVCLTSLRRRKSFTGYVGLPEVNASGYEEYRDTYLKIGATTIYDEGGSGRFKINNGSDQTAFNISADDTSVDSASDVPAILWTGTHASNVINITKGSLGVAFFGGEVATILTLKIGSENSIATDATIECGPGVTLGTVVKNGGVLRADTTTANITAITNMEGDVWINGTGNAVTLMNVFGGNAYYNSTATATAIYLSNNSTLDFRRDMRAKTVTNLYRDGNCPVYDPAKVVTLTNGVSCRNSPIGTMDLGSNIKVAVTAL